jgi:DNA-binding CsgD family transcriptional regulator
MTMHYTLLGQYLTELYAAPSIDERFKVLSQYIQLIGFKGTTYTFVPAIQIEALPELPKVFLRSPDFPLDFLVAYSQERLDRNDFTIRKVLTGETHPMDWREHELSGQLLPKEVDLIRLARERYGIINALSIPTMKEAKGAAGVSIISDKDDKDFQQLKQEQMETLLAMVRLFHETNFYDKHWPRQFIAPVFQNLSPHEKSILRYLASGKPMKCIQEETGISKSYADNILVLLRRRLGVPTTSRLMYLFGLLNALDDIPKLKKPRGF